MKKLLFIFNPKSGKAQIKNRLLDILDLFVKCGYQVQVHVTQERMDARNQVILLGEQVDLLICSGGDGTLNEVVSGIMELEHPPELGYIPSGSTNDFASSLGISKRMLSAARQAMGGNHVTVDVGQFCDRQYFVYVAAFGAFTEVSYLTPQDKKNILGHQAYIIEGVKSLAGLRAYQMTIEWEERILEGEFLFGMVTNTLSVGGFKGLVSQDVALDDGMFEVLLVRAPKTPVEFSNVASCLLFKEEESEFVYKFKTSSLKITSQDPIDWVLDGEFGGSKTLVEIRNLPRKLKIRKNGVKG